MTIVEGFEEDVEGSAVDSVVVVVVDSEAAGASEGDSVAVSAMTTAGVAMEEISVIHEDLMIVTDDLIQGILGVAIGTIDDPMIVIGVIEVVAVIDALATKRPRCLVYEIHLPVIFLFLCFVESPPSFSIWKHRLPLNLQISESHGQPIANSHHRPLAEIDALENLELRIWYHNAGHVIPSSLKDRLRKGVSCLRHHHRVPFLLCNFQDSIAIS